MRIMPNTDMKFMVSPMSTATTNMLRKAIGMPHATHTDRRKLRNSDKHNTTSSIPAKQLLYRILSCPRSVSRKSCMNSSR